MEMHKTRNLGSIVLVINLVVYSIIVTVILGESHQHFGVDIFFTCYFFHANCRIMYYF